MLRWLLLAGVVLVIGALVALRVRFALDRASTRAVHRFRARVNRFKLTRRSYIRTTLLADPAISAAVRAHAGEHGLAEDAVWKRVDEYIEEIVPHFNILAYYRVGYAVSRLFLNGLYRVSADYEDLAKLEALPDDAIVIYMINHRSNADYVLLAYVLAGDVSISYAVGEWARAFPLEYVFKSFGSYFIRRRFREPLYHTVLERYVQLITRNGVTQGFFPEGKLTRDGRLGPGKIGLLDYMLGAARDPQIAARMRIIPVALNFDRVLEDRSLTREWMMGETGVPVPKQQQVREVAHYTLWNLGRMLMGHWRRYGRAAVTIGSPIAVEEWLERWRQDHGSIWELPRPERLALVQQLCDHVLGAIGVLVPVTSVPLACAAIQSFDADFIPHDRLLARMREMREVLLELNAKVLRHDRSIEETFDRAWRMLSMRRMLVREGSGYAVLPGNRPLIAYYANSIAHLLGPFEEGLRRREAYVAEGLVQ